MKKLRIETVKTDEVDYDGNPYERITRTVILPEGTILTLPIIGPSYMAGDGGEFSYFSAAGDDFSNLQIQWEWSHGGVNPPQGTTSAYLVRRGHAKEDVDIGYTGELNNRHPGVFCRIEGDYLILED